MTLRSLSLSILACLLMIFGFLRGLDADQILNLQSLVIVFGGSTLVLCLGFSKRRLIETCRAVIQALGHKSRRNDVNTLSGILELARIYRLHGPLALERAAEETENDFLGFGATLIAEGYDHQGLLNALERESALRYAERRNQINLLRALMRLAPALGMAGTVISLMQVMGQIGQMKSLGPSLGLALSSTLYGILFANLLILPLATKVEAFAEDEIMERDMIIEGLLDMHRKEHPLRIAERLNCFDSYCRLQEGRTKGRAPFEGMDKQGIELGQES